MEREELLYALNEAIEERQLDTSDQDVTIVETAINILNEDADTLASYNESEQLTILEAAVEVLTEADRLAKERKKRYEGSINFNYLAGKHPVLKKYASAKGDAKYAPNKYKVGYHNSESFRFDNNDKYIRMAIDIANKDKRSIIEGVSFTTKDFYDDRVHTGYFYINGWGELDFKWNENRSTRFNISDIMRDARDKVRAIMESDKKIKYGTNADLHDRINHRTELFNRKDPSKASTQHESALEIIFGNSMNEGFIGDTAKK